MLTLVAVAQAITCTPVAAEDGSWSWVGLGMVTCEAALADEGNLILEAAYGQWIWGYWSGLNVNKNLSKQPYKSLSVFRDEYQVAKAIFDECRVRRASKVIIAAQAVYERLGEANLK